MIKKAMILAAGLGKRIQPLTLEKPKPLLKIGDQTFLSNTLNFLELIGISHVVINVHYLRKQIIDYIKNNNFNIKITIIEEKDIILDTGGGVLNVINNFLNEPFLIINPDTIWSSNYLKEIKSMEKLFFNNKKNKCSLLVVKKNKSFDKSIEGDFSLDNKLINKKGNLDYIYTGLQIIKPEVFENLKLKPFPINKIWKKLIDKKELYGFESNIDFLHISTLDIYQNLKKKFKN
jgi:N-acetyl-alpha-D-muramate 1-phosphate uridylyltransferase